MYAETSQRPAMEAPEQERLVATYVSTMQSEAKDKIGHEKSLGIIFDEINRQALDSFGTFTSGIYSSKDGRVSFSTIKLSVTPELVKKLQIDSIAQPPPDETQQDAKRIIYFLEPAFGMGKTGNAFSVLDIGIDRFIREIPKVAYAMQHGLPVPQIDIFLMGSPLALGGTVSQDWIYEVEDHGFDAHGNLYGEFIKANIPDNLENTKIIINGADKASVTAERTYHQLPDEIKEHTQALFDIPVGHHAQIPPLQIIKALNMGIGIAGEYAARRLFDRTTKDLTRTEGKFWKDLARLKNIPEDEKGQGRLKFFAFLAEIRRLVKGTKPDYEERGYYRAPDFDPTNLKLEGMINGLVDRLGGRERFVRNRGEKLFFPTSRKAHCFPWKDGFHRWKQVLQFAEGRENPVVPK
jgi:hypothetical protein